MSKNKKKKKKLKLNHNYYLDREYIEKKKKREKLFKKRKDLPLYSESIYVIGIFLCLFFMIFEKLLKPIIPIVYDVTQAVNSSTSSKFFYWYVYF